MVEEVEGGLGDALEDALGDDLSSWQCSLMGQAVIKKIELVPED